MLIQDNKENQDSLKDKELLLEEEAEEIKEFHFHVYFLQVL